LHHQLGTRCSAQEPFAGILHIQALSLNEALLITKGIKSNPGALKTKSIPTEASISGKSLPASQSQGLAKMGPHSSLLQNNEATPVPVASELSVSVQLTTNSPEN
jgi:hypothetical protein